MSTGSEPRLPEYKGFDLVFHHVGGKGFYQWRLLGIVSLQMMFLTLHHLGFVFLGAVPRHWCSVDVLVEAGWSEEQIRNFSIPLQQNDEDASTDGPHWEECIYYDRNYSYIKETGMSFEDALVAFPSTEISGTRECKKWTFDTSIYASTVVSSFDLVCENRHLVATIQSTYMGGVLVGSMVLATLSDKIFGRRVITLISVGMVLIAGIGAAFAPNYTIFVMLRFLLATGVAGSYQNCYVLLLEYADPSYRALLGVIEQLPFAFGCMLIPAYAYYFRNWSDLQLAFTLSALTLVSYYWILPDSSRWLASKGRTEEAIKILENVARVNKKPKPNTKFLQEVLESCRDSEMCDQQFGVWNSFKESVKNFVALVRTPRLRTRSLSLWCLYFSVTVVYYGLSFGSVRLSSDPYILFFLSGLMDVPAYCGITVPLVSRLGRKPVIIGSFFIAGISLLGLAFTPSDMTTLKITLALSGKLFIACAFAIIYLLGAELYPTTMRTTGLGAAVIIGRFGSIAAPYFVDIKGSSIMRNLPIVLFGVVSFVAAGMGFTLPETKETVMPDNIDDVENDCDSSTCGHAPPPTHIRDFNRLAPTRERTASESSIM